MLLLFFYIGFLCGFWWCYVYNGVLRVVFSFFRVFLFYYKKHLGIKTTPIYNCVYKYNSITKLHRKRELKRTMRYIDYKNKKLIIKKPIHNSITKATKNNKLKKDNVKYICDIPIEALTFLFAKYGSYDASVETVAEYIDRMLAGDGYFLCFNDAGDKLFMCNSKDNDNVCMKIKKDAKASIYRFILSKKVFNFLKDNPLDKHYLVFSIDFNYNSNNLKNSVIDIELV